MNYFDKNIDYAIKSLSSSKHFGLDQKAQRLSAEKFGTNVITKTKKQGFFSRIFNAFKEPMLLILMVAFIVAFGTNLGKFFKTGDGDFAECFGILLAIIVSVSITIIMEGSSEKAFLALNKIYENIAVRVIRQGKIITISQQDVLVGDILLVESGDKIVADGRLIESQDLSVDESALTGESAPIKKDASAILNTNCPLAERINCLYSGTFVVNGSAKLLITAIGDKTEMGSIASELTAKNQKNAPLQTKLAKLGKLITVIGAVSAILVFVISALRLSLLNALTFSSIQELFISCIVLIVAAVPEGLPTIVAISLALNMIKLAKSNALIRKMTATETAGAVSVICSDKTGTLTQNKMQVGSVCFNDYCAQPQDLINEVLKQNFVLNSTADIIEISNKKVNRGSATECALLNAYQKMQNSIPYQNYRNDFKVIGREPFSSQTKIMTTTISLGQGKKRTLLKGAPEKVLSLCALSNAQKNKILKDMTIHQQSAQRILCFAHFDGEKPNSDYVFDGFVAIADPIRKDVYKAVSDCKRAGISIKILTGDNKITAFAIAKELKIAKDESQVLTRRCRR